MTDIAFKYSLLNKTAKQEVSDFMDLLLSRQKKKKGSLASSYKKKILNVSTWTDSDIKIFQENKLLFNQWKIQKW